MAFAHYEFSNVGLLPTEAYLYQICLRLKNLFDFWQQYEITNCKMLIILYGTAKGIRNFSSYHKAITFSKQQY